MSDENFNIDVYGRLYKIFNEKRWHQNINNHEVFAGFCTLLNNLNPKQRELILDLTERYLWIPSSDYERLIFESLELVEEDKLKDCKTIFFVPTVRPEHDDDVKSAHSILYLMKGFASLNRRKFSKIKFDIVLKLSELKDENFKVNEGDLIFLVDDFLGSGETIKAALEVVFSNRSIHRNIVNVISIAAQSDAIKFLTEFKIPYYIKIIREKGISDYYSSPELEKNVETMQSIEKMIPEKGFQFGYDGSEALITMTRTPDNTFPIFWNTYKNNKKKFRGPFPRYNSTI